MRKTVPFGRQKAGSHIAWGILRSAGVIRGLTRAFHRGDRNFGSTPQMKVTKKLVGADSEKPIKFAPTTGNASGTKLDMSVDLRLQDLDTRLQYLSEQSQNTHNLLMGLMVFVGGTVFYDRWLELSVMKHLEESQVKFQKWVEDSHEKLAARVRVEVHDIVAKLIAEPGANNKKRLN